VTNSKRPTIAIVGGGFSGSMVAVHLLRQAQGPLRIVLIERDDAPGRGVAYRDQPERHLLNVRAEAMSAFPASPDHFLDWVNNTYSPCHPVGTKEFVPRRIYGAYIQWLLADAQSRARRGVELSVRHDEAVGIAVAADGATIRFARGRRLHASRVVLALGNAGPADPPLPVDAEAASSEAFFKGPHYLAHAWSKSGLYAIGADEDLLLVGSGLTALDWLAALQETGHRGHIHLVSRRGLLPQPHRPAHPQALSFDPLALPPRVRPLLRRLRAESAAGEWRSAIDALRPYTPALWQRLPPAEQRRFLRHVRPFWEIHRHRAPPRIADRVEELVRSGRLQVTAGRLGGICEHGGSVEVRIVRRRSGGELRLNVHRVVNCTGPESNYRRLNHPLIVNLREQGLIEPDALGLGLMTDANGALLDRNGAPSDLLFTLGPTRKGELWETTAVPEIRVHAQAIARRLLASGVPANRSPQPEVAISV
jgi:uncharacterized NAD(P)/FAD-binding protein YdhS